MCGIAGFQGKGSLEDARRMIACVAYRGPDLQDAVLINATGLAHARLSIIDLSHGADQPMFDAARELCIVFNGEIYNYKSLREELLRTGQHAFRTQSDTEVLLALYREHGAGMLPKLNGMFAFAIHDARTGAAERRLLRALINQEIGYYARYALKSPGRLGIRARDVALPEGWRTLALLLAARWTPAALRRAAYRVIRPAVAR